MEKKNTAAQTWCQNPPRVYLFTAGDKRPEKPEEEEGGKKRGEKDALFPIDESEKNPAEFRNVPPSKIKH